LIAVLLIPGGACTVVTLSATAATYLDNFIGLGIAVLVHVFLPSGEDGSCRSTQPESFRGRPLAARQISVSVPRLREKR
jgi:hypothetical protein